MNLTLVDSFTRMKSTGRIHWSDRELSAMPCGLHRVPLMCAIGLFPEMTPLVTSVPVRVRECPEDWVLDVKIHMLKRGQFPCIPNWHCDNVPRDPDGALRWDRATANRNMFLWLSGGPLTQFLRHPVILEDPFVGGHNELATAIKAQRPATCVLPSQVWCSISQLSAHRGVAATEDCWRVFARLTHTSISPARPVNSYIRRHAQVYLDASTFSW